MNELTKIKVPQHNREILPVDLRSAYDSLGKGLLSFSDSINLPGNRQIILDNYQLLWAAVRIDHPEIFYVDRRFELTNGRALEMHPHYTCSQEEAETISLELMKEVRRIDKALAITRDPFQIMLSIHDWIASTIEYDEIAPHPFDVIGALLDHKAVCQGISAAASLMLNYADIPCVTFFGKIRQKETWHAWNVVEMNNKRVHMDITNDLVSIQGILSHKHMAMSEPTAHRVFSWHGQVGSPTDFDYYLSTGNFAHTVAELKQIANRSASAGITAGEIKVPSISAGNAAKIISTAFDGHLIEYTYSPELEIISFRVHSVR